MTKKDILVSGELDAAIGSLAIKNGSSYSEYVEKKLLEDPLIKKELISNIQKKLENENFPYWIEKAKENIQNGNEAGAVAFLDAILRSL